MATKSTKVIKKIKREEVTTDAVLQLVSDKQGYEVAVGEGYYILYPLPSTEYTTMMSTFRQIWYQLVSDKDAEFADAVAGARSLSQNMGEIDDTDVQSSVQDLMSKLTSSKDIHPLEFITHDKFAGEINKIVGLLTSGCDEEDVKQISTPQLARLMEVCFIQNFLPFIRLAESASRVFRGGSD